MPPADSLITSPSNPLLKAVRKALRRGGATDDGYAVAESPHLLGEALRSGAEIQAVLVAEDARAEAAEAVAQLDPSVRVRRVEAELFRTIATTETSQGLITLVKLARRSLTEALDTAGLIVVLDRIQDPGNAGAIARTAEAFGAAALIFGKGSANPASPKAVRASAGSLFRLPFADRAAPAAVVAECRRRGIRLLAASSRGGVTLECADLRAPAAVVIGAESHGVGEEYREAAEALRIPTRGVESLNAAAAAAVILWEAAKGK